MNQILCALLILATDTPADTGALGGDTVTVFRGEFEADSDSNLDNWPDRWTRRRGRGYPTYVGIEIVPDDQAGEKPNRCLRVKLDGGAAEVFSPVMLVSPRFNYSLDARLRIDELKSDVVSFSVAFYDKDHVLLETFESERVQETRPWSQIHLGPLRPASDRVDFAVLSLHIRPTEAADLLGSVYVDDLVICRLPKIAIEMNNNLKVFSEPRDVNITCRVSGFAAVKPSIQFELIDVNGQVIDSAERQMNPDSANGTSGSRGDQSGASSEFAGSASWKPNVPDFGFYKIRLSTPGHTDWSVNLVVAPPLPGGRDREFGWSLPHGDRPLSIEELPNLLVQAGVGWVKFPVWYAAADRQRAEQLAWFAERLSLHHVQLVGVLDQPPNDVKSRFGSADWIAAATLFEDRDVWYPALDPVMTRLSLKVRWWQLGCDEDTSFCGSANLESRIRAIHKHLTSFGQQVKIGFPWRSLDEPPETAQPSWSFLSFVEALPLTGEELKSYFDRPDASISDKWIVLKTLPKRNYSLETRIRDLLERILAAKVANAKGIFIANPFDSDHGVMNEDGSPNELFLPWRTAASLLGGTRYLGKIKLPSGSENHIFVRDQQAIMVVWNDRPVTERVYLGEGIKLYDVWGKSTAPVERIDGNFREQELPVGPMPMFVTGVDATIARWRMNFHLETPRLASIFGHHQVVTYRFKNTLSQAVGGKVTVHVPSPWKTEDGTCQFKLATNEERTESLRVLLGPNVSSGPQSLRVDFELTADRDLHIRLFDTIEVGLGDVTLELNTQLDENGNLVLEQDLINNTDKTISFNCLLFIPDRRREKRQVFNIGQGHTTTAFVLENGRDLIGKTLWLRAEEINGARILNERIVAHE